jgi:EamA-like transporter family
VHVALQALSELKALNDPLVSGTLLFAILGPTVFAFTAMSFSSQKLKPSINASYITLQPMIVALLSLLLFGKTLQPPEIASGMVVLGGLYFTIIGNPRIDREWADYVSDLPSNVPQTIATVADAGVSAAANVSDRIDSLVEGAGDFIDNVRSRGSDGSGSDVDLSAQQEKEVEQDVRR